MKVDGDVEISEAGKGVVVSRGFGGCPCVKDGCLDGLLSCKKLDGYTAGGVLSKDLRYWGTSVGYTSVPGVVAPEEGISSSGGGGISLTGLRTSPIGLLDRRR